MTERYERIRKLLDERDALREALEDIRSRSAMNLAMHPDPVALTARLGDIHQIADAALSNGEAEMSDRRLATHGHDCWGWGPKHYECAVSQVKRLAEALREDAERLAFLASEPVVEGFVGVEKDIYDYACDAAEESGRDEPSEADMLAGLRRMIDAAIDQARGKGGP